MQINIDMPSPNNITKFVVVQRAKDLYVQWNTETDVIYA